MSKIRHLSKETRMNQSTVRNKTGYLNVSRSKSKTCQQGFIWNYTYYVDRTQKAIHSADICNLKERVEKLGLPWKKISEPLKDKYYRVSKQKSKNCSQGYTNIYQYYDEDGVLQRISSVDLHRLEEKVRSRNLPWYKLSEV